MLMNLERRILKNTKMLRYVKKEKINNSLYVFSVFCYIARSPSDRTIG